MSVYTPAEIGAIGTPGEILDINAFGLTACDDFKAYATAGVTGTAAINQAAAIIEPYGPTQGAAQSIAQAANVWLCPQAANTSSTTPSTTTSSTPLTTTTTVSPTTTAKQPGGGSSDETDLARSIQQEIRGGTLPNSAAVTDAVVTCPDKTYTSGEPMACQVTASAIGSAFVIVVVQDPATGSFTYITIGTAVCEGGSETVSQALVNAGDRPCPS